MKLTRLIVTVVTAFITCATVCADVIVNPVFFPDEAFRYWLMSQSYGSDGFITDSEIASVSSINISGSNIQNLKGIEYFTALTDLDCHDNKLTSLDVSKNTVLKRLHCYSNQINATGMEALIASLPAVSNGEFYVIYSKNESNQMTRMLAETAKGKNWPPMYYDGSSWVDYYSRIFIDESNFPDANFRSYLLRQSYGSDGVLTQEEIAGITSLQVSSLSIKSLQGIGVFTALTELYCSNNQLTDLDISKNIALSKLSCNYNKLHSLDISRNTALTSLECENCQLTTLDVSHNTGLTFLNCAYNSLNSLDIAHNYSLLILYCYCNQLTSLDLSKNSALTFVMCFSNQLTSLDVSNHSELTGLMCSGNQLTSLNVSGCTKLNSLEIYDNQIKDEGMDAFVASLPRVYNSVIKAYNKQGSLEGNVMTSEQVTIAKGKGWAVKANTNGGWEWEDYMGEKPKGVYIDVNNFPDFNFRNYLLSQPYGSDSILTNAEIAKIPVLLVPHMSIRSLQGIEYFTSLVSLECQDNLLTSIYLAQNTSLVSLTVYGNYIREEGMSYFIASLPTVSQGFLTVIGNKNEGNMMTTTHVNAAKAKGWTVKIWDGANIQDYAGSEVHKGDVSGIGIVKTGDVMAIASHIIGKTPSTFDANAADVNNDGKIDVSDMVGTVNMMLKGCLYQNQDGSQLIRHPSGYSVNNEYGSLEIDSFINEYMKSSKAQNQVFYLEGGKAYHISGRVNIYKGLTLQTNPADMTQGKRAKLYIGGISDPIDNTTYVYFRLGRQPISEEEATTQKLSIDKIRFVNLDVDVPEAKNYGHEVESYGYPTGNYFMLSYNTGLELDVNLLEWNNCTFQGFIRGFFRIAVTNNIHIHNIKMVDCDFYNCGYYNANGAGYSFITADNRTTASNTLENVEVSGCVFYNSPMRSLITDNNRNMVWDADVRWNLNVHHNTFVNFCTTYNYPIINTSYIPGGSVLAFHDNVIILTKDSNDVERTMMSAGWNVRNIQGGDGTGQCIFDIYNNWTTNDSEYLTDGQPFTANAFDANHNSPGMFFSGYVDYGFGYEKLPHGIEELKVHLDESLRATDLMVSPNPQYFFNKRHYDFHTDIGIEGLRYKNTNAVKSSSIYQSGAGCKRLYP